MYTLSGELAAQNKLPFGKILASVIVLAVFILIVCWLYKLQVKDGDKNFQIAVNNAYKTNELPAPRGKIFSSDGQVIAFDTYSYKLSATEGNNLKEISKEINLDSVDSLSVEVTEEQYKKLEEKNLLDNLKVVRNRIRIYPFGESFGAVSGYVSEPTENDIAQGKGRESEVGKDGIEKYYDSVLTGVDGTGIEFKRFDGSNEDVVIQSPKNGDDLYLTIDSKWQKKLYDLISSNVQKNDALGGGGVIVESSSGKVMALASYPGYDPNDFIPSISQGKYSELSKNTGLPFVNKVISVRAAPGSTFKTLISSIALADGLINPQNTYYSAGCENIDANIKFCEADYRVLGDVNFYQAISRSSNLYFCNVMKKFEGVNGLASLFEGLDVFGIEKITGIDLFGEVQGNFPSPEEITTREHRNWGVGDMCNMGIGQGDVLVTPIRMVTSIASFVNGGTIIRPYLLDYSKNSLGEIKLKNLPSRVGSLKSTQENLAEINKAMRYSVEDISGTGQKLSNLKGNIRIKTGSADVSEKLIDGNIRVGAHSWVVGSFEYDGITYSYVIFQEFGGRGYKTVPIIGNFVSCLYEDFKDKCEVM